MQTKKIILSLALSLLSLTSMAKDCLDLVPGGKYPEYPGQVILCKTHFVIGYLPTAKTLVWASENIGPDTRTASTPRPPFKVDPTISPSAQSHPSDFEGGVYDRGHMVPFEDMTFDASALQEVMYMTNMVPQVYQLNRGMWKSLEIATRKYAAQNTIYVVTGPIYEGPKKFLENNPTVPIPTSLFKTIFKDGQAPIGYIIPNSIPVNKFSAYGTTIDKVEAATGITFSGK